MVDSNMFPVSGVPQNLPKNVSEAQVLVDDAVSKIRSIGEFVPIKTVIDDPVTVSFNNAINDAIIRVYASMASIGDQMEKHWVGVLDEVSKTRNIDDENKNIIAKSFGKDS